MKCVSHRCAARRIAVMGGAYGNVPALAAAMAHAKSRGCGVLAFAGDAIGSCGHSDETLAVIRRNFQVLVAGNHEQQAASSSRECGCNYASAEDETYGCRAFEYAATSLSEAHRRWLGSWPDLAVLETDACRILVCHGSPAQTNEFLYESELTVERLEAWLREFGVDGFVCTHSGLPWVRRLSDGRFAANCGVVGKPDHDGDPAVHYAIIEPGDRKSGALTVSIERVDYDHTSWADQLAREGVDEVFVTPLRTGVWTCGVSSLPESESEPRRRNAGTHNEPTVQN